MSDVPFSPDTVLPDTASLGTAPPDTAVPLRPAATLLLARDGAEGVQLLLLRRSESLSFAAGHWVFPGGAIDRDDFSGVASALERSKEEVDCDRPSGEFLAAQRAAVRETREEAGLELSAEPLCYYAHWVAPPLMKKRFSTWFFLAPVTPATADNEVQVDGSEIDQAEWFSPRRALREIAAGQLSVLPPTRVTLIELADCDSVEEMLDFCRRRRPPVFRPRSYIGQQQRPDSGDERFVFFYHGDAGYDELDPDLPGERHRLSLLEGEWCYENTIELSCREGRE